MGRWCSAAAFRTNWLAGRHRASRRLRTPYGPLESSMAGDARRLVVTIAGRDARPPGGLVFAWPFDGTPAAGAR